jgi:hypothetical protein
MESSPESFDSAPGSTDDFSVPPESAPAVLRPLPVRFVQVFFSPGELFSALREKPVWFGAMAVVAVLVGVGMALIPTEMWVEFSRNQMLEMGQEVPAGFEATGGIVRIISVVGAVIMTPVMMFVLAGIVTGIFSFLLGGEGSYKQYLSVVAHASIITGLSTLLLVPLKISQVDPTVTLSVGTFFSFLGEGYVFGALRLLDLFALWSYGVMAIGVTKMDPRRSFGFALTVFIGFALAFALIFALFGGAG